MKQTHIIKEKYKIIRRKIKSVFIKYYLKTLSVKEVIDYDNVIIVASHPDDEAFACGGLISLLRSKGSQVSVVFMTNGGASHERCRCEIPSEKLGRIRRQLAIQANRILSVDESNMIWLDFDDMGIPDIHHLGFERACNLLIKSFQRINPQAVFAPHFMDVRSDHIATSHIVQTALIGYGKPVILYYYPVWFFYNKLRSILKLRQLKVINIDINDVKGKKEKALKIYNQAINPICGHPFIGVLPDGFVELFQNSYELFFTIR